MSFRVVAIPEEIAAKTRETLMAPQFKGMPADVRPATGYGPCRSCLTVFKQGEEERICITYNSFDGISDLPDPGPIFIHKAGCKRFDERGFPTDLLALPLFLEGFGDKSRVIVRERMVPESVETQIGNLFGDDSIGFINLRNAEAGCFVARVERLDRENVVNVN